MTKLFLTQPLPTDTTKKDGNSPKVSNEIFTVFQASKLPVVETPDPSVVKRERKTRTTCLIGIIFILWLLALFVIILHFAPGCIYRSLHAYTFSEGEARRYPVEKYVIDPTASDARLAQSVLALRLIADRVEEPNKDLKVEPKSSNNVPLVDGEGKVERKTDDASEAIQTLLRRPDVQHLVIVGKKETDDEQTVKGVMVINGIEDKMDENRDADDERALGTDSEVDPGLPYPTQQTFLKEPGYFAVPQQIPLRLAPQSTSPMLPPMDPFRQAIIRWKMLQFLRHMMILHAMQGMQAMQTPSGQPNQVPPVPLVQVAPAYQNIQGYQSMQQYPQASLQQVPHPLIYFHHNPSMMQPTQAVQHQAIQPMQVSNTPKKLDSPHQFPLQVETDRQPLVPQQENIEVIVDPNLPVEREPGVVTIPLHESDVKTSERDLIFKLLQARSQEIAKAEESQQKQKKTDVGDQEIPEKTGKHLNDGDTRLELNEGEIKSDINDDDLISKDPIDAKADEQQTAMVMIEDTFPRRPAQVVFGEDTSSNLNQSRANPDTTDAKADEDETSLVMIEDKFPRESSEEAPEIVQTRVPAEAPSNTSDPLAAFFRFFEQEAVKKNQTPRNREIATDDDFERARAFKQFFEEALERDKQEKARVSEYEDLTETTIQPFDQATALYTDLQEDASGMEIELDVPEPARAFQDEKTESPKQPENDDSARVTVADLANVPFTLFI